MGNRPKAQKKRETEEFFTEFHSAMFVDPTSGQLDDFHGVGVGERRRSNRQNLLRRAFWDESTEIRGSRHESISINQSR